jgi:hypothetical protein
VEKKIRNEENNLSALWKLRKKSCDLRKKRRVSVVLTLSEAKRKELNARDPSPSLRRSAPQGMLRGSG